MSMLQAAIRNNALWCDAVCAAQGSPGTFSSALWFHNRGTPPLYPDAITLTGPDSAADQTEAIAVLIRARTGDWAVKDSYAALDLSQLGFDVLFDAEWIGLERIETIKAAKESTLEWRQVADGSQLKRWVELWGAGNSKTPAIFADGLLRNRDIAFLLAIEGDVPRGGGVLNRHANAVGMSNLFAVEGDTKAIRSDLVSRARELFPGLPVVGYEHGGRLAEARQLGFAALGPLRVWLRG
jgi:hypothetical protein